MDTRLQNLTPEQRRLLAERLRTRLPAAETPAIPRRSPDAPSVLSFGQQRLWFLDQLTPGSATYNVPNAWRLSGPLDVAAFDRALCEVIRRHDVLRTTFAMIDGRPAPAMASTWASTLRCVDFTANPDPREIDRLLSEEGSRPFDLSRDVMLRALLIQLQRDEHIAFFVSHHIAWDPGSRVVFHKEMEQLYTEFSRGDGAALPELHITYADFASWQRESLRGETLERLVKYWTAQLENAPASLELPSDRPRPRAATFRGWKHKFVLPARLIDDLGRLSVRVKSSLYMTLLAAFGVFLSAASGQFDIVVGSPIAGRSKPELENLIGFFINTLALRLRMQPRHTFEQVVRHVREVALAAYAHQDLPFEKLVEIIRPPRDRSRNPIFQVNFRLAQAAERPLTLPGLTITPLELVDTRTSKFDLALEVSALANGVSYFEYNTDLFEDASIARMRVNFQALLEEIVTAPDTCVEALDSVRTVLASASTGMA